MACREQNVNECRCRRSREPGVLPVWKKRMGLERNSPLESRRDHVAKTYCSLSGRKLFESPSYAYMYPPPTSTFLRLAGIFAPFSVVPSINIVRISFGSILHTSSRRDSRTPRTCNTFSSRGFHRTVVQFEHDILDDRSVWNVARTYRKKIYEPYSLRSRSHFAHDNVVGSSSSR